MEGCNPDAEACFIFPCGHSCARTALEAAVLALEKLERGMECEDGNVPENNTEVGKDGVGIGSGGGEVVLPEYAVFLRAGPP